MNPEPALPARLKPAVAGLGQANQIDIERRAVELALSDGRDSFTDQDLARAAHELAGGINVSGAPEVDSATEEIETWDEPPMQSGHRVPPVALEDENGAAEQLVTNGMEEADHDVRVAAARDAAEEVPESPGRS